jgi:muramidase (phage lysozyme)
MNKRLLIVAFGAAAACAYWLSKQQAGQVIDLTQTQTADGSTPKLGGILSDPASILVSYAQDTGNFIDGITMGIFNLSGMKRATPALLLNPNVKAFLQVIRTGEGTTDANGYRRIFGGQLFNSFADHPRVLVSKGGYKSTAAGAYQFLSSVWDETKNAMGLKDFSPASQDLAALGRIAARGALDDVLAGRFALAISKTNKEWASLPNSPYGQPTQTLTGALAVYQSNGGTMTA